MTASTRLVVWWLPLQRLLWSPTRNPDANKTFLEQAQSPILLVKAEDLDDGILAQLWQRPGALVSVSTHQPTDQPNV